MFLLNLDFLCNIIMLQIYSLIGMCECVSGKVILHILKPLYRSNLMAMCILQEETLSSC